MLCAKYRIPHDNYPCQIDAARMLKSHHVLVSFSDYHLTMNKERTRKEYAVGQQVRKVGIVTLFGLDNYGNRLQNLAVHQLLKDRGCSATSLVIRSNYPRGILSEAKGSLRAILHGRAASHRLMRFRSFNRQMNHQRFLSESGVRRSRDHYDCFITGSDQVWNPHFIKSHGPYFLDWALEHQRIALAPSFGVDEIPAHFVESYTRWLNGFPALSVREDAGADLIHRFTGRHAQVLIDPTLALGCDQWRAQASGSLQPSSPYLLTYFLGQMSEDRWALIDQFCRTHELRLVPLSDPTHPEFYSAGPAEFLDLIDHAACVFTDSFHGSAFSLILETPLVIFDREASTVSMSSRLETFARTFGLAHRVYPQCGLDQCLSMDYKDATELLQVKRREFHEYLDRELARVAHTSS